MTEDHLIDEPQGDLSKEELDDAKLNPTLTEGTTPKGRPIKVKWVAEQDDWEPHNWYVVEYTMSDVALRIVASKLTETQAKSIAVLEDLVEIAQRMARKDDSSFNDRRARYVLRKAGRE